MDQQSKAIEASIFIYNKDRTEEACKKLIERIEKFPYFDNESNSTISVSDLNPEIISDEYDILPKEFKKLYTCIETLSRSNNYISTYMLTSIVTEENIRKLVDLVKKTHLTLNEYNIIKEHGTLDEKNNAISLDVNTYPRLQTIYVNIDRYVEELINEREISQSQYNLLSIDNKKLFIKSDSDQYISIIYLFTNTKVIPSYIFNNIKNTDLELCFALYQSASGTNYERIINIISKSSLEYAKKYVDDYIKSSTEKRISKSEKDFYISQYNDQKKIYNKFITDRNKLILSGKFNFFDKIMINLDEYINLEIMELMP